MKQYKVKTDDVGKRVDAYLSEQLKVSRSITQKLCSESRVQISEKVVRASQKLKSGDTIQLNYDVTRLHTIPEIAVPVIYEDDDVIVLNKPPGLLTHSKGTWNPEPTVASFIKARVDQLEGERAGIVHRLDRGTSGVIICAKNEVALQWLQKQFATRKVHKIYIAIVSGHPKEHQAVIDMPIARHPKRPKIFRVDVAGKPALTKYQELLKTDAYSLLQLEPHTGRTHQLRVHLAKLGLPIVGDALYGGLSADRLYLHAFSLALRLPNGQSKTFTASTPKEFDAMLNSHA